MTNKTIFAIATLLLLLDTAVLCASAGEREPMRSNFSSFTALNNFTSFTRRQNENGGTVLLSPAIESHIMWNQLIVSWNASATAGAFLKMEAAATSNGHQTRFYIIADWSPEGAIFPRASVRGQQDDAGRVDTDTLVMS